MSGDRSPASWVGRPYSYPDVGATRGKAPPGYRPVTAHREIGVGRPRFDAAVERLAGWRMHRRAGVSVEATAEQVRPGVVAVLGLGPGPLRVRGPVRVVYVLDEPTRWGFAYGTLPGHPETGEELFVVHLEPDGVVRAQISAFSRPGSWLTRLGGPVTRRVQDRITERYLDALL